MREWYDYLFAAVIILALLLVLWNLHWQRKQIQELQHQGEHLNETMSQIKRDYVNMKKLLGKNDV